MWKLGLHGHKTERQMVAKFYFQYNKDMNYHGEDLTDLQQINSLQEKVSKKNWLKSLVVHWM